LNGGKGRKDDVRRIMRERNRVIRERKFVVESVSDFIADACGRRVKSREDILSALEELRARFAFALTYIYTDAGGQLRAFTIEKVLEVVREASDVTVSEIVEKVNRKVSKMEMEDELARQLEERLNRGAPPSLDVEVIELVQFTKNFWGIKVRVGANTYLFDFEGTLDELAEALLELRREQEEDIVTCPFCGARYVRAFVMEYLKECSCGARIVYETAKDAATGYSPELEGLWRDGCSALGIPLPENRERLHIDDFFENVKYVGKGATGWRMWFVKKPWRRRLKAN
jgi:hypothetical protein